MATLSPKEETNKIQESLDSKDVSPSTSEVSEVLEVSDKSFQDPEPWSGPLEKSFISQRTSLEGMLYDQDSSGGGETHPEEMAPEGPEGAEICVTMSSSSTEPKLLALELPPPMIESLPSQVHQEGLTFRVLPSSEVPLSEVCGISSLEVTRTEGPEEPEIASLGDLILQNSRILLGALQILPGSKEPKLTSQRVFFFDLGSEKWGFSKVEIEVPNSPLNHKVWVRLGDHTEWLVTTDVRTKNSNLRTGVYQNSEGGSKTLILSGPVRFTLYDENRTELFAESRILLSVVPSLSGEGRAQELGWCVIL